ncbi:MAG TPA: ATP-binding cassette domain-containing protein, partial [Acetobacteraceae bacterium]
MMRAAIEFRGVDIVFAGNAGPQSARVKEALRLVDAGMSRAEIARQTGLVAGVTGASLMVEQGEISVLMGLSGSGKSTLLRAANGLNQVTRGQVLLRDGDGSVDLASCDAPTLRRMRLSRVAMVFQSFALLPWRTVRENVGLGLELRGVSVAERRRLVDG